MRYFALLVVLVAVSLAADWQDDLDSLLKTTQKSEQEILIEKIASKTDWTEVYACLKSITFVDIEEKGTAVLKTTICIDSVERPWVLYIPSSYDPKMPIPLLVILHGGVSRVDIIEEPKAWVEENPFTKLAEENGWLALYPLGQQGSTWWDNVGMGNIRNLVRRVKSKYNVDDDRVWMGGFSDGGSASFLHAMVSPNDYGAFIALNGHMGVGNLDGDLPTYATNFYNTPLYAVTTDRDQLYPSHKMRPTVDMARNAGGDILYREIEGEHDFSYADEELPRIAFFLERHPRDPLPTRIVYETASPQFGHCRWFAIDRITTDEPAHWYVDYNTPLVDDRVTVGFFPDYSFEGDGVKVNRVMEETAAEAIGLQEGDIIVKGDKYKITSMDDFNAFKSRFKRGDAFKLVVRRDGEEIILSGTLPEPTNYYLFKREQPSAVARVSFSANRVDIEASRLGAFRILVHPDLFRIGKNIVISVNGQVVYDATVKPEVDYILKNFLENRDCKLLYVAEIRIEL